MSAVTNPTTIVGPWYPPMCDKTCGEGKPKEHLHQDQLHIRLHTLAHNGYQIETLILVTALDQAALIVNSLPDDADDVVARRIISSTLSNGTNGVLKLQGKITGDKQANSLIHRRVQRFNSLTTVLRETLPKVLLELINSYFGDLLPTLNKALLEGRYGNILYEQIKPPLPIIKEALK